MTTFCMKSVNMGVSCNGVVPTFFNAMIQNGMERNWYYTCCVGGGRWPNFFPGGRIDFIGLLRAMNNSLQDGCICNRWLKRCGEWLVGIAVEASTMI